MIKKTENSKDLSKIKDEIFSLKKSLLNMNFQKSSGQLEKTSNIKKAKRDIAKLKTQITQLLRGKNA